MKYQEYTQLDLPSIDRQMLEFWEENHIFDRSVNERSESQPYVFYEGPPSANGKPGIHHVMARTVKDMFCRFHTMLGKRVERKGGWDTHGLPIELSVEKELGITKEDIGAKISIADYNAKCRETVMRYKDLWDDLTRKMGYWVDLDNPYITFENSYIESVWYLLQQLFDKDLLYKGYTIQPFSPAAGTGLSSHELNQPGTYREVKDTSVVAQFKVEVNEKSQFLFELKGPGDIFFLAWTTTPWTLPSNTALGVGKKIDYALVQTWNPYTHEPVNLILANDLLGTWFKIEKATDQPDDYEPGNTPIPCKIIERFKGDQLAGLRYEQLLPYAKPTGDRAFQVLLADFVSTEEGTGIVHLAPSFGADDKRMADKYGIPSLTLVDKQGRFTKEMGEFAGRYVKNYTEDPAYQNVDIELAIKLKKENRAFNVQKYAHNYPHCWRTDKPILYYPLDSWFVRSTALKERMAELNKTINWKPSHTGQKRFGNWLENLQDWNLSRSRFWGIPLPIWRTDDKLETKCIGSIKELSQEIELANKSLGLDQKTPEDLHRPYIDEIILASGNGKRMMRETDLIDVWFDSGSMPYAQWHYPFENTKSFENNFPADFIAEGVDQTRGWFFTLHAIAVMVFDSVAYKNVVSNGLVQDKIGRKMSKRLGNTVEPFETIQKYGADATRWYLISNAQPWDNLKFDLEGIDEVKRKFFGTLYNTYSFFALYANIDGFKYSESNIPTEERQEIDRWIISQLHSLIKDVKADYENYEPTLGARKIMEFVDNHLSNWYVRLSRRRFWKGTYTGDKIAAYQTLYTCLETISKLMAPLAPFFADWLYRNLNAISNREAFDSVHLSFFPNPDESLINKDLEIQMSYAQKISSLALSLRKKEGIRVRQPLKRILLPVQNDSFQSHVEKVKDLILAEINVKEIEFIGEDSNILIKRVKPNFKTLGKRLGRHMKDANLKIQAWGQDEILDFEQKGTKLLQFGDNQFEIGLEDVIISFDDIPGWQIASSTGITVAVDTNLDDSLRAEGIARELVNRIQNMRKDQGLEVIDRIKVEILNHPTVQPAVQEFGRYIQTEVLADSLVLQDQLTGTETELLDGITIQMKIDKL